jgi:hypothetical protein
VNSLDLSRTFLECLVQVSLHSAQPAEHGRKTGHADSEAR